MEPDKILTKALKQLHHHAKENYSTEKAKQSPPRRTLRGLIDTKALNATNGISLPWISAAKETYQSHMAFNGIETLSATGVGFLGSRLEDDFLRESDSISAALVETGFAALLFGVEDTGQGKRIRMTSYSGKNSTVIRNEWGDPEFGVIIVDKTDGVTTAEIHDANGWTVVKYRKDGKSGDDGLRILEYGETQEHGLGVCLFVPLVGKRIINQEAVSILSDAILVHQMAFVSDALHTSPRELFTNVPIEAAKDFRNAQLGSPLNGPLVLPRIPEAKKYENPEAQTMNAPEDSSPLETQAVGYTRSFGGDNSASYAEQLKRAAFSFVQVVPMPESWAALTPGGLNGILGADELKKMSERFFSTVDRLNRSTSLTATRALNQLLEVLGNTSAVEIVFGARTAYEVDKETSPETTMSHVEFSVMNGMIDVSTPAGVAIVGKLWNLNSETIAAIQSAQLRGRAQRLLDDANSLQEEENSTDAPTDALGASEGLPEGSEGGTQ